jgi:Kef-type K+ transport system membrane component KefB
MSDVDATHIESVPPPVKPRLGLGLVGLALILPVLSGIWLCFVTSFPVALCISAATLIATAALVSIDASRLGQVDLKGRKRESAGLLFVGICLLWIVIYPVAFFRRSAFGSPNLGFVAMFVAAFFISAPFLGSMVLPVRLPSCTSSEVKQVLEQVIRTTPVGATSRSIDGHRELSHDRNANVRRGECVAHTDSGDVPVKFIIEWQNREKGLFQVRILGSAD